MYFYICCKYITVLATSCSLLSSCNATVLSCYDNPQYSRYCLSYWQQRYCLIKRNFMLQNCPRTCGFCSVSGGKQCRNEASNKDCSYWQRSGYCTPGNIYYQYMQRNCKHSCGFCWTKPTKRSTTPVTTTTTTTTTMAATAAKSCQNSPHYNKQCPDWKEYCRKPTKAQPNEYYQFMKDHCKKECNFPCDDKDKNENGNKEEEDGKSKKKYKINEENCGIDGTSENSSTFVVAGADAIKNKWRWQVALYYFSNFFCGGSLITPLHVLTAAHCLVTRRAEGITVVAGDHDRDKKEGPEQNRDVEKFVVHEDYNRANLDNDIALIILKEPVAIDPTVGTVCLPNPDEDIEDILYSGCYITGWGRSEFEGDERFVLQEALLPYVSKEKCDERNINYFGKSQITENMLCAGFDKGKVSGCKGDSGGPFVCKKYIGKWILEGVTSFGSNICDAQHKYTVFAKTRKFMQWIRKQIE